MPNVQRTLTDQKCKGMTHVSYVGIGVSGDYRGQVCGIHEALSALFRRYHKLRVTRLARRAITLQCITYYNGERFNIAEGRERAGVCYGS